MFALVICASLLSAANAARILGVFMTPSYSHQVVYQPIWKELSLRGHQVTVLTPNPLNDPSLTNLTEIDLSFSYKIWNEQGQSLLAAEQVSMTEELQTLANVYYKVSDAQLAHTEVQKLIKNSTEEFDLILVEFIYPVMYAFKDIYNCPMVGLSSIGLTGVGYDTLGNPRHPSINPEFMLPFAKNLNFRERVISSMFSLLYKFSAKVKALPKIYALAKKHFGNHVRNVDEIAREVSLVIVNSNLGIHNVKPSVPALVDIAGIHIHPPKQLPKDLEQYMDNAKEGVIYFSLGSNVKSNLLPKDKLKQITDALGELPFKVLWKFENENLPNKPKNVEIRKWLPQQDILGHPNIKGFVFQGGVQSFDEAIHNKVPLLAIPLFADQRHNAHRIVESGAGLSINFHTMTKDELRDKIIEVATDKKYKKSITKLSAIASDHQIPALEKAVWWIEYVLRHDGAEHLRYGVLDLPFYQYYLLDVISFAILLASISVFIIRRIVKHVILTYELFKKFLFDTSKNQYELVKKFWSESGKTHTE